MANPSDGVQTYTKCCREPPRSAKTQAPVEILRLRIGGPIACARIQEAVAVGLSYAKDTEQHGVAEDDSNTPNVVVRDNLVALLAHHSYGLLRSPSMVSATSGRLTLGA